MQTLFEDVSALVPPCRLRHDPFWPSVHCAEVRQALSLDEIISDLRLEVALHSAIIQLERDLAGARFLWRREGFTALEQVSTNADKVLSQYRETLYECVRVLLAEQLQVKECSHG